MLAWRRLFLNIINIILATIFMALIVRKSLDYIHIVQLKKYENETYEVWINKNTSKAFNFKFLSRKNLRPFVFTNRAKRLFVLNFLLNAIVIIVLVLKFNSLNGSEISNIHRYFSFFMGVFIYIGLYLIQPLMVLISNYLIGGFETSINENFYKSAQEKIKNNKDLKVVGISGSFGKTSTKFIIDEILSASFQVLNTPESHNTPMGLSKVINNQLEDRHDVFIAEMGSMKIGDIKSLTDLVSPEIGVITSIGESNMETFINIDNITKTQYELIEGLSTEGIGIFNYDNEYIKKIADKTFKEKILYGLEEVENLDIYGEDIYYQDIGTRFTIKDKQGNQIKCRTKLLGIHNVYNILAGVSVGKSLGLNLEDMKEAIDKIEPFPHRMQTIRGEDNYIIIDDSANANPMGGKVALDVLSQFKDGNKIIVTPGMVDLGEMESDYNYDFGVQISKVCDYVILIDQFKTRDINRGLEDQNYNLENVYIVEDLAEAKSIVGKIVREGDIVLYENQLPC